MSISFILGIVAFAPGASNWQPVGESEHKQGQVAKAEQAMPSTAAVAALDKSIQEAKRLFEASNDAVDAYLNNRDGEFLDDVAMREKIRTLREHEIEKTLLTDGLKYRFEAYQSVNPEDLPVTPDVQKRLAADPKIRRLEERLQDADLRVITLSSRTDVSRDSAELEAATAVRDALEQQLQLYQAEVIVRMNTDSIEDCRRDYLESLEALTMIKDRRIVAYQELLNCEAIRRQYDRLVEERNAKRRDYERLFEQHRLLESVPAMIESLTILREKAAKDGKYIEFSVTWDLGQSASGPNVTMRLAGPLQNDNR